MEFDTEFYEQEPDILVDYEEDRYPPVQDEDYDYEDFLQNNAAFAPFTFDEILENCILPTSNDGLKYVGPMIFWCLVFRILTQCCKLQKWPSIAPNYITVVMIDFTSFQLQIFHHGSNIVHQLHVE